MTFEESWKENRHLWESTKDLAQAMYLAGKAEQELELKRLGEKISSFQKTIESMEIDRRDWRDSFIQAQQRIGDLEDAISCSLPYIETTPTIFSVLKDTLNEGVTYGIRK